MSDYKDKPVVWLSYMMNDNRMLNLTYNMFDAVISIIIVMPRYMSDVCSTDVAGSKFIR